MRRQSGKARTFFALQDENPEDGVEHDAVRDTGSQGECESCEGQQKRVLVGVHFANDVAAFVVLLVAAGMKVRSFAFDAGDVREVEENLAMGSVSGRGGRVPLDVSGHGRAGGGDSGAVLGPGDFLRCDFHGGGDDAHRAFGGEVDFAFQEFFYARANLVGVGTIGFNGELEFQGFVQRFSAENLGARRKLERGCGERDEENGDEESGDVFGKHRRLISPEAPEDKGNQSSRQSEHFQRQTDEGMARFV